jgi:hypothetical protein
MITVNRNYDRANLIIELENFFKKNDKKFVDAGKFFAFGVFEPVGRFNMLLPDKARLSILVDTSAKIHAFFYSSRNTSEDTVILVRRVFCFPDIRRFVSDLDELLRARKIIKNYTDDLFLQ